MRVGALLVLTRLLIAQLSSVPLCVTVLLVLPAAARAAGGAEACEGDQCPVPAGAQSADEDEDDFVVLNEDDSPLDDEDELLEPSPEAKAAAAAAQKGEAAAALAASSSEAEAKAEESEEDEVDEGEIVSSTDADGDAAWQEAAARKKARASAPGADAPADGSPAPAQHASPEAVAQQDGKATCVAPQSKLSQSKVVSGAAVGAATGPVPAAAVSVAADAPPAADPAAAAATVAAAADSPAPVSGSSPDASSRPMRAAYSAADLNADLAVIQVTAQLGLEAQLLDGIANVTFGLGDTDGDGALTRAEAEAFAARHLSKEAPLGRTLGLSGGEDASAVREVVDKVFAVCDRDKDGRLTRDEARADSCMRVVLNLLEAIPEPAEAEAQRPAGAGSQQSGMSELEELMKQAIGGGAAGGARGGGAPARRPRPAAGMAEALVPLRRYGLQLLASARANLGKPNLNTALAGMGVGCLMLREMLRHDLFKSREALGGVIGGPLPQFLARLRNLALAAIAAGALLKFD